MPRNEFGTAIIQYDKPDNLVEVFEETAMKYSNNLLFGEKDANGVYQWVSYGAIKSRIDNLRGGLANLGVGKGDTVGIIAGNRKEWFIGENASHGLGARWVPMYEKELFSMWNYIIRDAAIKVLFVSSPAILEKVQSLPSQIPTLKHIIVIEGEGPQSMVNLEIIGKNKPCPAIHPKPEDIAVLIYTSGTTGEPKGVLLSHGNLTFCSQSGYHIFPQLNQTSRALSNLPWAHSYAISAELHNFILFGGSIGIMGSIETLANDLLKVQPTHLMTVPRLFNKIYNGIWALMKEEGGMKEKLFLTALAEAKKKRETGKSSMILKVLDKLVFKKIRAKLGGNIIGCLTASAPMSIEVATFFNDVGIPTFDCYGMTETSPAITMNSPLKGNRLGSVGLPVEKTCVKIDKSRTGKDSKDGEIIAFGPQVMVGYHNKPEKTAEVIVVENGIRGMRTGDRGWIDNDGYLYITGRFKEEYKLENGLYIHPDAIEREIKLLPWVANAMIYGDGKPYNVALIVPDFQTLRKLGEELKLSVDPKDLFKEESESGKKLKELLGKEIQSHLMKHFGGYEVPKKFLFIDTDFTVDNGLLTQTLKLKRPKVIEQYLKQLEQLYK